VEREWDWWGPERWVGMVRLGSDRWKGLCTRGVILNEGRWRRKWTWNRNTGETILEARMGELSA